MDKWAGSTPPPSRHDPLGVLLPGKKAWGNCSLGRCATICPYQKMTRDLQYFGSEKDETSQPEVATPTRTLSLNMGNL
jgi:hypothetical protein